MIDEFLAYNKQFVTEKAYEPYVTTKYPDKKVAIVSCMDTRLTQLLMASLGIKNGDVKMIKNAGGIIQSPFDSTIRSLLVGVYELGVKEIMIIGHTDCGAQHLDPDEMIRLMLERGVSQEHIDMMKYCGIDFRSWLNGFNNSEEAVRKSVEIVAKHPLMPKDIIVRAKTCGHAGVIEFNGDVYSCDHYVFPEFKLGNIYEKTLIEMMYSDRQLEFGQMKQKALPTQCRNCEFLFACNGECPKNRFAVTPDGEPGLNYLCKGYHQFFSHVAPYMDYMKRELLAERAPANVMEAIRRGEL